jgi:hypothetical protein
MTPAFSRPMAAWVSRNPAWMSAFWDDTAMGAMDPDDSPARLVPVPQARQAFLAEFG